MTTLTELDPAAYATVHGLFEPLFFRTDLVAVIARTRPGMIWVDDSVAPGAALLTDAQGYALVGLPTADVVRDLRRLVTEVIYRKDPLSLGRKAVRIVCHPDDWLPHLPEILDRTPIPCVKRSCHLDLAGGIGDLPPPDGYEIRDLDRDILSDPGVDVDPLDLRAMEYGAGTVDAWLERFFACTAVHGGRTVSTCFANDIAGEVLEVGIRTRESHRRKGVGSAAVAATLRRARERGFRVADWHCDVRNAPSVRMAEHLGFTLHREYDVYLAVGDEATHDRVTVQWREGKYV